MTDEQRAEFGLGEPRFLLFGGDDTRGLIEDYGTIEEAIAVVERYREAPETLPEINDNELHGINELAHGVEYLGDVCPYQNHGQGRSFYVTHFNCLSGYEPDMPEIVVNV